MIMKRAYLNVIKDIKCKIKKNYNSISIAFENEYGLLKIDPVRKEICYCLLCEFNQAAITLTNHLLESFLKEILITYDAVKNNNDKRNISNLFNDATNKYANKNLHYMITKAYDNKLITEEEENILHDLRNKYRNPFSHADPQKIFKGMNNIPASFINLKDISKAEDLREKIFSPPNTLLSAKNNIMIQGILQSIIAEKESTKYFLTLDNIIRNVRKRLYTNIKKVSI